MGSDGYWTNDLIYSRLAHGVLDDLRAKTTKTTDVTSFTDDIGHPKLQEHIIAVNEILRRLGRFPQTTEPRIAPVQAHAIAGMGQQAERHD